MPTVEERVTIREKNRLTIPKSIADVTQIHEGSELIAHIDDQHPNIIVLRVVRATYAGSLTDVFANTDPRDYVNAERATWE